MMFFLSVWYEAKSSGEKKQGELVMLSTSNKNKLHELMIFHRGQQGEGSPPDFKKIFSE